MLPGKKRLRKKPRERYQIFSKKEKVKRQQYGRKRCKNLSKDEKQKSVEYKNKILQNGKKIPNYNYK